MTYLEYCERFHYDLWAEWLKTNRLKSFENFRRQKYEEAKNKNDYW